MQDSQEVIKCSFFKIVLIRTELLLQVYFSVHTLRSRFFEFVSDRIIFFAFRYMRVIRPFSEYWFTGLLLSELECKLLG